MKMKLYKVSFVTDLFVEALNDDDAEAIAIRHLVEEVNKNVSDVTDVEEITSHKQVVPEVLESLPWRSHFRHNEPKETIMQLLDNMNNK
jgi:hypothetical protein